MQHLKKKKTEAKETKKKKKALQQEAGLIFLETCKLQHRMKGSAVLLHGKAIT